MNSLVRRPLHLQDGKQQQKENMLRKEEVIKTGLMEENGAKSNKVQYVTLLSMIGAQWLSSNRLVYMQVLHCNKFWVDLT